ncbi:hypothetical protein [Actinobacillus equuli]|uniref:hypothetical protein n=1 Tax=Actinobacillus equuli TaxID=718 RepID=UPI002442A4B2|nr:hypothetical protein [Actinobacillus equuli]WGE85481.1 hypothetical protein NYR87_10285 [Actinobacillus equuli subsp. haemolyticus]
MKKLLISLGTIVFAMNAVATSTLDQAKLNTVTKVYQTGNLYKYATPDFKKLLDKKAKYDKSHPCDDCVGHESWIDGPSAQDFPDSINPKFKLVEDKVYATFLFFDERVTIKFSLDCNKNNQCLVSDFITAEGDSYKKSIMKYIK